MFASQPPRSINIERKQSNTTSGGLCPVHRQRTAHPLVACRHNPSLRARLLISSCSPLTALAHRCPNQQAITVTNASWIQKSFSESRDKVRVACRHAPDPWHSSLRIICLSGSIPPTCSMGGSLIRIPTRGVEQRPEFIILATG